MLQMLQRFRRFPSSLSKKSSFEKCFFSSHVPNATSKEPPSEADVVIIGGGSMGASTLYHLAQQGVNAILLEKDKLTAGTTWHSAGLLWRLRPSDIDIQLIDHTRKLAKTLEKETGMSTGWIENGGLFIADNKERLSEYQKLATLGKYFDIESHVLSPEETKKLYPLMNTKDLYGTLHSPGDGTIDPSNWVMALAKGARMKGGRIYEGCRVSQITTQNGKVAGVTTSNGAHIKTKVVVNCAGVWAPSIGKMVGVDVPLCAMHHAYVVTEPIAGIQNMPNVRDHDASVYLKLQGDTLQVGGYENNPIFWDEIQENFAFSLFDLNWDVFSSHIEGAMKRIPCIGQLGITSTVCGPESFTPDHKALLGEVNKIKGFYLGCGFNSAGIMLAGGCGRELAQWIIQGTPDLDMFSYDINRFHPSMMGNKQWIDERSHEAYSKNYAIVFPHDEPLAGRNIRLDPFHNILSEKGCVFQQRHGWERPGWFVQEEKMNPQIKPYDYYGNYGYAQNQEYGYAKMIEEDNTFEWGKSHDVVKKEVLACRQKVAVFNQSYFGKFFVEGKDAQKAMDWICTNNVSKPVGSTVYTSMCNDQGGVECDLTVSRIEDDDQGYPRFYIAAGGTSASHDFKWIQQCILEKQFECTLLDETENHGMLSIQGPYSQPLLEEILKQDLSNEAFPFSTNKIIQLDGFQVRAIRLTFVGELGWELHIPKEHCVDLYHTIFEIGKKYGVTNAGYRAIDSLSIEKGYKHWHEDLRSDDTPLEAGLGFICKLKTNVPFKGRKALEKQKREGLGRKLACFLLDDHIPLSGNEAIWRNDKCVGFLRRGDFGHTLGKSIGYGYVQDPQGGTVTNKFLSEGEYHIETLNAQKCPAKLSLKPCFDPENRRIKGQYDVSPNKENVF